MSTFFNEPARQIPVAMETDVIVAGGGTAGVVAAIASARKGVRTLLIEQFGFLGGTQSAALVTPLAPNYLADGSPLTRGIGQEIWDRMARRGYAKQSTAGRYSENEWPWFDPEGLKYVLDEMVVESGVELLLGTIVSDTIRDGNSLKGLIIENKSGRQAVFAKVIVDATGDADVAFRAGATCENGRPGDGLNQPGALRFHLGNVGWKRACDFLAANGQPGLDMPTVSYAAGRGAKDIEHVIRKAIADGVVDLETIRYFQFFAIANRPGEVAFNCPEVRCADPTNAADVTRFQLEGRRMILGLTAFCRKCIPGFEDCFVSQSAPLIGIRSSRRVIGSYVLTAEDVGRGRKFEDAIARNNWPIDIHSPKEGEGLVLDEPLAKGDYVEVPYRCLVAGKPDNLLIAGRCISATFEAQAAIRISRTCQALGQAAGTAAAMCVAQGVSPTALDGMAVRSELERDGMM